MTNDIRRANSKDIETLGRIYAAASRVADRGVLPDEYLDDPTLAERHADGLTFWFEDVEDDLEREPPIWVYTVDERVVAYCAADRGQEPDVGDLIHVYVDPDFQRRSIGSALMDRALDHLREMGLREATLWVYERNRAARDFYEARRWSLDGAQIGNGGPLSDQPMLRYRRTL